jgi:hypothetical protein
LHQVSIQYGRLSHFTFNPVTPLDEGMQQQRMSQVGDRR